MLYNLLVPFSQDVSLLNVFRYITFRSAGALICALLFTILTGPWFLKKLTALKVGQPILSYVPEHQSKAGTPTMGGLLIMAGAISAMPGIPLEIGWLVLIVFAAAVLEDIHPRDSWRAGKAFRQHIAVEMARRCLIESIKLAGGVMA